MEYIDVLWHHSFPDEPVRLVSELDAERYEVRKLEFFADGHVDFADADQCSGGTWLGQEPCPPLAEINEQEEFTGTTMEAAAFEELWRQFGPA